MNRRFQGKLKVTQSDIINILGDLNAVTYEGVIDCSSNPNYPAADAGDVYIVSVAGKIGGASGIVVIAGDMIICKTDSTATGDQATVGANWNVIEKNIDLSNIIITGGSITGLSPPLPVASGGTGATTLVAALQVYHGVESIGTVSFSNANKTLDVTATTTYWYKGVEYVTGVLSCDLDLEADRDHVSATLTTNTLYYFYFKDATGKLYWSPTAWDLKETVPVATVFWNGSAGACRLMQEQPSHISIPACLKIG